MGLTAARFAARPSLLASLDRSVWVDTSIAPIDASWDGRPALPEMRTFARLGWTSTHLWLGFECAYTELDCDDGAIDTTTERGGLWERDVCEAFIASPTEPHRESYKEFEVAPTGQWCDLAIHRPRVDVDMCWHSGLDTAARVDHERRVWHAVMCIPFAAFGATPSAGDVWRANLFRIGRHRGQRHYLAYAPTGTPSPDFHVPAAFVPLTFI